MIQKVRETLLKHHMVDEGDSIVVGFSGGADSLALISVMSTLYPGRIVAVHVNHLFRGDEADADAAFVEAFCHTHAIPLYSYRVEVSKVAKELGLSFEEAGRMIRYEKFELARIESGSTRIATAHNQNDVVETLLINLFRGSGIDGLASIDYVRDHKLIRPLLDISRECIEEYCKENQLIPRVDYTNAQNDYTRNRIRNELLPYLKLHFNPKVQESLFRTASIMKEERIFWNNHIRHIFSESRMDVIGGFSLKGTEIQRLSKAEMRHLIRYSILQLKGSLTNISSERIESVLRLDQTGKRVDLDEECKIIWQGGDLHFIKANAEDGDLPELSIKLDLAENFKKYTGRKDQIVIDCESLVGNLHIRRRKKGDRFVPFGMNGHKKLKDFFIDEKIPEYIRDQILLVCDDEKIVWVYGYRMSNLCRITEDTKNIAVISLSDIVQTS